MKIDLCYNARVRHGHAAHHTKSITPTYWTWQAMIARCTRPTNISWKNYGGRGIRICKRWRKFENFLADMGPRPVDMTIDRYPDPNGNYEPGNCRWATRKQQAANKKVRSSRRQ
jgi:hypothetical protein